MASKPNPLKELAAVGVVILLLFGTVGGVMAFESVNEGHVKVVTERGEAEYTLEPGDWYFVNFITKTTHSISTRPKMMKMVDPRNKEKDDSIHAVTSDQTQIKIELSIRYKVNNATLFYDKWKNHERVQKRLIRPTVRSAVYTQAGAISLENISSKYGRMKLHDAAVKALHDSFSNSGITLLSVDIRAVQLPPKYLQSVLNKQKAKQQLKQAKINARKKKIKARAEAKANRIVSKSLTHKVLVNKYIKSLDKGDVIYVPVSGENGLPTVLEVKKKTRGASNTNSTSPRSNSTA